MPLPTDDVQQVWPDILSFSPGAAVHGEHRHEGLLRNADLAHGLHALLALRLLLQQLLFPARGRTQEQVVGGNVSWRHRDNSDSNVDVPYVEDRCIVLKPQEGEAVMSR